MKDSEDESLQQKNMENNLSPEIYEAAENELAKIKTTCEISREVEPELLNALLHYYEMKKASPADASELWGKVQHKLDSCSLKSC